MGVNNISVSPLSGVVSNQPQNILNQNVSPFLGGSLNGSTVPVASGTFANTLITTGINPTRGLNTGFGQTTTTNITTGGPMIPPSSYATNNIGVGINGMNSVGGGIGTGIGVNPAIPNSTLTGVQTNPFSPPGFQRTPIGINQLNAVTPVGNYGTAPVGIPFVQPTGVPPVAIPRRI